jgi:hypothetical protein
MVGTVTTNPTLSARLRGARGLQKLQWSFCGRPTRVRPAGEDPRGAGEVGSLGRSPRRHLTLPWPAAMGPSLSPPHLVHAESADAGLGAERGKDGR